MSYLDLIRTYLATGKRIVGCVDCHEPVAVTRDEARDDWRCGRCDPSGMPVRAGGIVELIRRRGDGTCCGIPSCGGACGVNDPLPDVEPWQTLHDIANLAATARPFDEPFATSQTLREIVRRSQAATDMERTPS